MAPVEKDRRSRMAISTVKAAPKKDGAGGQFTWGSMLDVTDYEPMGGAAGPLVFTGPAPALGSCSSPPGCSAGGFKVHREDFPALLPSGQSVWSGPRVALSAQSSLRSGAVDLFDAQHPRHLWAKKPHHASAGYIVDHLRDSIPHLSKYLTAPSPDPVKKQDLKLIAAAPTVAKPHKHQFTMRPAMPIHQPVRSH
ncbi:unnamed protein product [Polarella glacialis]|uniref:Uncharacterized protein n=1 Tax=Polarella glacialis TaxID=89957 RepID=A0A813F5L5_POLGL|nr:unnamed protein product [Polarella glacialis]CAE8677885.1 unnamed protein product [Polarella glacialis]